MEREEWARNTLERAATLGHDVYYRARRHHIDWPEPVAKQKRSRNATSFTSIDEAFSSIQNYLSTTTKSCKKYYRGANVLSGEDLSHCSRFHNPKFPQKIHKTQRSPEDIHMMLPPGSYSISAQSDRDGRHQSHIVHIQPGQTVDVDFVL